MNEQNRIVWDDVTTHNAVHINKRRIHDDDNDDDDDLNNDL